MAESLDFTRSVNVNIKIAEDRIFDAILDFSRSDDGAVDFSGDTIRMDIYDYKSQHLLQILTSGVEITILTNRLSFDTALPDLTTKKHIYRLYNVTTNIAIAWGYMTVTWS